MLDLNLCKAYMRHGDDGCGCTEAQGGGIVCECGDGSMAGAGVGAPLHAHYVRGCAWECDDGFDCGARESFLCVTETESMATVCPSSHSPTSGGHLHAFDKRSAPDTQE